MSKQLRISRPVFFVWAITLAVLSMPAGLVMGHGHWAASLIHAVLLVLGIVVISDLKVELRDELIQRGGQAMTRNEIRRVTWVGSRLSRRVVLERDGGKPLVIWTGLLREPEAVGAWLGDTPSRDDATKSTSF